MLPYNPKLKKRAQKLRKAHNKAEVIFWNEVKQGRFLGLDFDRQKIIGNYIVDFYCANCNVVIEIDGTSHIGKEEYDLARDAFLQSLGLSVFHIPAWQIVKQTGNVMRALEMESVFNPKSFRFKTKKSSVYLTTNTLCPSGPE
jgi:very-short-patch-repair endonuclease